MNSRTFSRRAENMFIHKPHALAWGVFMSYVKIWIHAVWCTKNHERILSKDIRRQLFQHVRENAKEKQIDFING